MDNDWTARQLRALELDATIEERIEFDAGIVSLIGRSTPEGLTAVVWCEEGQEDTDIATIVGYLAERFTRDEIPALNEFCAAGPSGWPRTLLHASIGIFERLSKEAADVQAMRRNLAGYPGAGS